MEEPLEEHGGLLPADAEPAVVLEPGDGAFDGPPTSIASEHSPVLRDVLRLAIAPMRRDEVAAHAGELIVERVAVVGLVAADAIGRHACEHEVEEALDELALVGRGRRGVDGHGQAAGIDQHHDFHAFSGFGDADAIAAALGLAEGGIDEALVKPVAVTFIDEASGFTHDPLEDAGLGPGGKPAMDRALAAEASGQVLPLGTVVEDPEDALERTTLVRRGASTLGRHGRVGHSRGQPVELFIGQSHRHARLFARPSPPDARFWDSLYAGLICSAGTYFGSMRSLSTEADTILDHSQIALRKWRGVSAFRSRIGPGVFPEHSHNEVQVSVRMIRRAQRRVAAQGSLSIAAAWQPHGGRLVEPSDFVLLYFDPDRLNREGSDATGIHQTAIVPNGCGHDPWLELIVGAIESEIEAEPSSGIVAEALILAVQTRLLVVHSSLDRPKWVAVRPLPPRQLRHAVGLLEDGLTAGTGVDAISRELGMGVSRFAKAFRASLGVPPHRYLMERRIERAKRLLATTKQPLASIAVACGFASQSHMTEHLRRFCGITPARLRSSSANGSQESEF